MLKSSIWRQINTAKSDLNLPHSKTFTTWNNHVIVLQKKYPGPKCDWQFIMIVYRSVNKLRNFLSTATPSFSQGFGSYFSNFPRLSCRFQPRFLVQDRQFAHQDLENFSWGISSPSTSADLSMLFWATSELQIK